MRRARVWKCPLRIEWRRTLGVPTGSWGQYTFGYCRDVLALVVELDLNPEVSKPTIKLTLSRSNVQPP